MYTIRPARPDEDEILARLYHNAFRGNWDLNWYSCAEAPLPTIPLVAPANEQIKDRRTIARLRWFRSIIRFTRLIGGHIDVLVPSPPSNTSTPVRATTPSSPTSTAPPPLPAAVSCWHPPHVRVTLLTLLRSGWIRAWLGLASGSNQGGRLRAPLRFLRHHHLVERANARGVASTSSTTGITKHAAAGFVQLVATDPDAAGHGYAARLLEWQIARHTEEWPGVPVVLETMTAQAERVYSRLGFRVTAREGMRIRADESGFEISKEEERKRRGNGGDERGRAEELHVIRAMLLDLPVKDGGSEEGSI